MVLVYICAPGTYFPQFILIPLGKKLVLNYAVSSGTHPCHEIPCHIVPLLTRPQVRGSEGGVGNIEAFYPGSDWRPTSENSSMYRWMLYGHK
jgi:hypothetical protein